MTMCSARNISAWRVQFVCERPFIHDGEGSEHDCARGCGWQRIGSDVSWLVDFGDSGGCCGRGCRGLPAIRFAGKADALGWKFFTAEPAESAGKWKFSPCYLKNSFSNYLKNSIMGTAVSAQPRLVVGSPRPWAMVRRILPSS